MILDDKVIMSLPPPPPYLPNPGAHVFQPPGAGGPPGGTPHGIPASPTLGNPPPPFSESQQHLTAPSRPLRFSSLPPHILLQIVYNSSPMHYSSLDVGLEDERHRKVLLWLAKSLRLVNKSFYIACMHVLRSTYLPAYESMLRPYYSSDPFPSTVVPQAYSSTLNTVQRETPILDLFIALRVREDVFVDDSELHLEREDMFKDIFDLAQPKARLEDLVRVFGMEEGVVTLAPPGVVAFSTTSTSPSSYSSASSVSSNDTVRPGGGGTRELNLPVPFTTVQATIRSSTSRFFSAFTRKTTPTKTPSPPGTVVAHPHSNHRRQQQQQRPAPRKIRPIPFALLSVTFATRKVGLQLMSVETGSKRTIVEVQRMSRDESLETAARRIVDELKVLLTS